MSAFLLGTISRQLDQIAARSGQPAGVPVAQWNDLVALYNAERQRTAQLQATVDFLQRDVAALEENVEGLEKDWDRLKAKAMEVEATRDVFAEENRQLREQLALRSGH